GRRCLAAGVRRDQRLGDRVGAGVPGTARLLRASGGGDRRHAARLRRGDRACPAPVPDPQQRPVRTAGFHPRARRRSARQAVKSLLPASDSPLRNGSFLQLMVFRLCSILSYQVVAVTVGWHVYEITRHPFSLGLIGLAEVIPYCCTAPFAGYLVDHVRRRRLGMLACLLLAVTPLLLVAVPLGWLPVTGTWAIYAAVALTGS